MQPFIPITSPAIKLDIRDVDTDMIIPAQFLTSISSSGYGEHLFERLKEDPEFPFNHREKRGYQILITRSGFGCGSSREHAVWALLDWGIRVIISPSFGDIFSANATKNGLLLITVSEEISEQLFHEDDKCVFMVSLEDQTIMANGETLTSFTYDPFRKYCLLNGIGDLEYLMQRQKTIDAWISPQPWMRENIYIT